MKRYKRNIIFSTFMPIIAFLRTFISTLAFSLAPTLSAILTVAGVAMLGGKILSNIVKPDKKSFKSIIYVLLIGILFYLRGNADLHFVSAISPLVASLSTLGLASLFTGSVIANSRDIIKEKRKLKKQDEVNNIKNNESIEKNEAEKSKNNKELERLKSLKRDLINYKNLQEEKENYISKTK